LEFVHVTNLKILSFKILKTYMMRIVFKNFLDSVYKIDDTIYLN